MEENTIQNFNESDEISLKDIVLKLRKSSKYLISRWTTILIFTIIGTCIGFGYGWYKKPVYKAITTFVLEDGDKGSGAGQYAGLASMVGLDLGSGGGGIFQGDNILELYKSRLMIEKSLLSEVTYNAKKILLVDKFIAINKLREKWSEHPDVMNVKFDEKSTDRSKRLQDSLLGTFVLEINKSYLSVSKPDKKLNIIVAEVKSNDEFFSKAFNDQIVKTVNDFYIQTKTKKSLANVLILQHKADSVRSVMNGAIYSAAAVTDATPNLNITRQIQRSAPLQRSQFNAETNKQVLSELVKNLELSKMNLLKETPLIQVIDQPIFPLEEIKFGKTKGSIIGAFLGGVLTILTLLLLKFFRSILK